MGIRLVGHDGIEIEDSSEFLLPAAPVPAVPAPVAKSNKVALQELPTMPSQTGSCRLEEMLKARDFRVMRSEMREISKQRFGEEIPVPMGGSSPPWRRRSIH